MWARRVPLLTAGNFKVLAGSTVTNTTTPPGTTITGGDLGLSPGTSVTGFPPGQVIAPGVMHVADATAAQAQVDLTAAYNFAAGIVLPAPQVLAGDLTGLTLTAGTYKTSTSTGIGTVGGILTLTGDSSSVFVFQIGSTLTTLASTAGGSLGRRPGWQRVLASRKLSHPRNELQFRGHHYGPSINHVDYWRNPARQGAGTKWRGHIGQQYDH